MPQRHTGPHAAHGNRSFYHRHLAPGIRPFCRRCGLRAGRLSSRCYACRELFPGVRPRIVWQLAALAAVAVLVAFVAGPSVTY